MQIINLIALYLGYSLMIFCIVAVFAMPFIYGVIASVGLWNWIAARFGSRVS